MRKPRALRAGDPIAVVAPGGTPDREKYEAGLKWLAERYVVQAPGHLLERGTRYLSGSREQRTEELRAAYLGPSQGVFAARGGYGAMHLLGAFANAVAESAPKLMVGFSDVTALGNVLLNAHVPWLHAPLLTTIAAEPADSQDHLLACLEGRAKGRVLRGTTTLNPGRATGVLVGGSLSLLSALCGTKYFPNMNGALLFLEDTGEQPYRLDRMWTQLELAGAFDQVRGVILGHFNLCEPKAGGYTCAEVMKDLASRLKVPVVAGFSFGHQAPNYAIPVGVEAELNGQTAELTLLEEVVEWHSAT